MPSPNSARSLRPPMPSNGVGEVALFVASDEGSADGVESDAMGSLSASSNGRELGMYSWAVAWSDRAGWSC